jgi:hypothetical protein
MHYNIKIITGKDESGKTLLAKNMMLAFDHPLFIDGRSLQNLKSPFLFSEFEDLTDLIVIDDVPVKYIQDLIYRCYGILRVEKRGFEPEELLSPKVIITTSNFYIENYENSIKRRIEVIDTSIDLTKDGNKIFNAKRYNNGRTS